MKKRNLRKIHIGEEIWKWYLKSQRPQKIIVFSPMGKRIEIPIIEYIKFRYDPKKDKWTTMEICGLEQMVEDMAYNITPGLIKEYIQNKLV